MLTRLGLALGFVFVPPSSDCTHIFETEVSWSPEAGKTLVLISKGAIFVRRSGSSQVLTAADFEHLVERRLLRFREKVMEGMARVVHAAPGHEVLTVSHPAHAGGTVTVKVEAAPAQLGLSGRALILNATTPAERVELSMALAAAQAGYAADRNLLFSAYASRDDFDHEEKAWPWLAHQSLLVGAPAFYWLAKLTREQAHNVLEESFQASSHLRKVTILRYSGFFGKSLHDRFFERLGKSGRDYGAVPWRAVENLFKTGPSDNRDRDQSRATELARTLANSAFDALTWYELEKLDCAVYAPF
jgi:hypothetical protein